MYIIAIFKKPKQKTKTCENPIKVSQKHLTYPQVCEYKP